VRQFANGLSFRATRVRFSANCPFLEQKPYLGRASPHFSFLSPGGEVCQSILARHEPGASSGWARALGPGVLADGGGCPGHRRESARYWPVRWQAGRVQGPAAQWSESDGKQGPLLAALPVPQVRTPHAQFAFARSANQFYLPASRVGLHNIAGRRRLFSHTLHRAPAGAKIWAGASKDRC